jgi:hypothetical protein
VVTTEAVILMIYFLSLPFLNTNFQLVLSLLLLVALLFPVAFYHHSWSLWLTIDHLIEKLPEARDF